MVRLILAVGKSLADVIEEKLQERTAGLWPSQVHLHRLDATDKQQNTGDIDSLARKHPTALILASQDLCSKDLDSSFPNVRRLKKDHLVAYLDDWLADSGLSWRANAEACRSKGSFNWLSVNDWCQQFARVDPEKGRKVAAAILAQLRVATVGEMAAWFDGLSEVDHNLYFIGADPHSGDHSLVNVLSSRIDGSKLSDALKAPVLLEGAKVRLFADAAWSGGESERRIECLYTACEKKVGSLGPQNHLSIRFAYLTNLAEDAIAEKVEELATAGKCTYSRVKVTCPEGHRLEVNPSGKSRGLAFQRKEILDFIDSADPQAMRALCKQIGEQIAKRRPLGTDDIASTIAFEHSLPRAMLPVLIFGGPKVKAHDGTEFVWKPLVQSRHVDKPAKMDESVHCAECPLTVKKAPAAAEPVPQQSATT